VAVELPAQYPPFEPELKLGYAKRVQVFKSKRIKEDPHSHNPALTKSFLILSL